MSVLEIILSLITIVLGGISIVQLVTIKQIKRLAKTDVEKGNIELASSSVNQMLTAVKELMQQNRELVQDVLTRDDENQALKKKVNELNRRVEKMQKAIGDLIPILEKLSFDEKLLKALREQL